MMDIDLRSTMDIQITALEWMPEDNGYVKYFADVGEDARLEQLPDGSLKVTPDRFQERVMSEFEYPLDKVYRGNNPILLRLQEFYRRCWVMRLHDPYISLIVTILTQNKTADSARKTFHKLQHHYNGIDVHKLAGADKAELEELIRKSGPYKADYIITCSQQIIDRYGGSLEWMRKAPTLEARNALISLYGVGPKTADCVLLFALGHRRRDASGHAHLPRIPAYRAEHGNRRFRGCKAKGEGRPREPPEDTGYGPPFNYQSGQGLLQGPRAHAPYLPGRGPVPEARDRQAGETARITGMSGNYYI